MELDRIVPPGSTIGIVGGGQLGRMIALAAARLGYRCHIFCPEADSPAIQVAAAHTVADYEDHDALEYFAASVDVITFEFENVPAGALALLAERVMVRPHPNALAICQDRVKEKRFFAEAGIATARWLPVSDLAGLESAVAELGAPCLLKTARFGYDGKGQARIKSAADIVHAWTAIGGQPAILEAVVDFEREISVLAARDPKGNIACYDVSENHHKSGILDTSIVPANISPETETAACAMAERAILSLGLTGLLAVEMFVARDGTLLANEMAPRPHNSGHWTIDACEISQFEQLVRAVCGLPLGSPKRHSDAVMTNLIGAEIDSWPALLKEPDACLHIYGKKDALPGRKMGHVTRLRPKRL
jgi:5-(carboxyamino)imidazole ribonucleotide synthase